MPFDRVEAIDMKHKHESEILAQVVEITRAKKVEATADEEAALRHLEEFRKRSEQDAVLMAKVNEKRRREQALLEQARGHMVETQAVV